MFSPKTIHLLLVALNGLNIFSWAVPFHWFAQAPGLFSFSGILLWLMLSYFVMLLLDHRNFLRKREGVNFTAP